MDHGIKPSAPEPIRQFGRRNDVGELTFSQVMPFAIVPEQIAHRDIRATGVVKRGYNIRSDKTGAAGHQQHSVPCLDLAPSDLPQSGAAGNLAQPGLMKTAALPPVIEPLPTGLSGTYH